MHFPPEHPLTRFLESTERNCADCVEIVIVEESGAASNVIISLLAVKPNEDQIIEEIEKCAQDGKFYCNQKGPNISKTTENFKKDWEAVLEPIIDNEKSIKQCYDNMKLVQPSLCLRYTIFTDL